MSNSVLHISSAKLEYYENGLLVVTLKDDLELTLEHIIEQREAAFSLTGKAKHVVLAIAGQRTSATEEARKYAASFVPEGRVAEAIIVRSLPVRLLANFYMKFHKPGLLTKLFEDDAEAICWLEEQLSKVK